VAVKSSEKKSFKSKLPYLNKEISWLSFNERILEEARDPSVPLLERIRFLGIFSNNLDEFFRVRVAVLNRLIRMGGNPKDESGATVSSIHKQIEAIIIRQNKAFEGAFQDILTGLAQDDIFILNEKQLSEEQSIFVKNYFRTHVRPKLMPIMFDQVGKLPLLRDQSIYLAVALSKKKLPAKANYALIVLPSGLPSRFVELPRERKERYLMLLDDVIRFGLNDIFGVFGYKSEGAFTIKLTRDAELEMDNDVWDSYPKKIAKSLKGRKGGKPVRFIYDAAIPKDLLTLLIKKLRLGKSAILLAGGRYHNFRDFMNFPDFNMKALKYPAMEPLSHPGINREGRLLKSIRERDVLIHFPYHSFGYIIDFLREGSIDPKVISMHLTIYRVARNSNVLNALINAVRNGKEVSVVLELQARFDEETNIEWGNRLADEGVKVIYGVPGLKVHSKLALLVRREKKQNVRYAIVGTGNFNEDTARSYLDHCLITKDKNITKEVHDVFKFYESNYQISKNDYLLVSPFNLRKKIIQLIKTEINNARKNKPAYIDIKANNLVDREVIDYLYKASQAGVKVRLIVRSMFSLVPGVPQISENIEAIRIVDRFLEHSRIFVFCNGGKPKYYIGSADLMPRNLDRRVEVLTPILDPGIREELRTVFEMQWKDNVKSRRISQVNGNIKCDKAGKAEFQSQWEIYRYLGSWPQK